MSYKQGVSKICGLALRIDVMGFLACLYTSYPQYITILIHKLWISDDICVKKLVIFGFFYVFAEYFDLSTENFMNKSLALVMNRTKKSND